MYLIHLIHVYLIDTLKSRITIYVMSTINELEKKSEIKYPLEKYLNYVQNQ